MVIAADPDEAGSDAARDAWFRWTAEGRKVQIATPNGSGDSTICCWFRGTIVADGTGFTMSDAPTAEPWGDPDMSVLRLNRRPPPNLSLEVFGAEWRRWIIETAEAAGCPPDYVAAPLLALVSALIGHARWAQATPGWAEPPHLWICSVGEQRAQANRQVPTA